MADVWRANAKDRASTPGHLESQLPLFAVNFVKVVVGKAYSYLSSNTYKIYWNTFIRRVCLAGTRRPPRVAVQRLTSSHMRDHLSSPLKDEFQELKDPERSLRSSSPAVKRPAAEMDGQEHEGAPQDIDMSDIASTQTNNGKRQKSEGTANTSNPGPVSQAAPSEESSISESTMAGTSHNSRASTAATSDMDSEPTTTAPSIDEQIAKVTEMIKAQIIDGTKGYCVSGKWLSRVLARSSEPVPGIDKSALDGEIGPVDNVDIAMVIEGSGELMDEAGEPYTALRPGLTIGDDFQVVPEEAWNLIVQWHGLAKESPIITRYAHAVSEENPFDAIYELNPPIFSFLKVVGTQTAQTQKEAEMLPPRMLSSVHRPYMEWLKAAKEKVKIDVNTKVRVWKILGGIKSTAASGILTPAASRSASPAPGAEIVASAGNKMVLDVHSFSLLSEGDQRELIDHKDHTMDTNYNGKVDLRTIGLGRGEVIALEEQNAKSEKYPSEDIKFSMKGSAKAKNLTVSGRSSPTPSMMMTRGRAQKEGRPKGIVGLQNLGNTCYMNSALQCIRSVEELTEYFRSGAFASELNPSNPLGHHGKVATAYASFIKGVYSANGVFNPKDLKNVVGKYGPSFQGYGQQDSQEFLAFLLDGLSEDLNRIHKKPYIEKPDSTDDMVGNDKLLKEFADRNWNDYKARNDSVIVDLFAGMYKSTLTCPTCDKVSIVFDPFSSLTLQLPIENNWSKEIIYFPLHSAPFRIDVDIDKNSSISELKAFVGQRTKYSPAKMMAMESYKNKFFKVFDNTDVISDVNISANDIVVIYELTEKPTNYKAEKKKKFSLYTNRDSEPKVDPDGPEADQLLVPVYHRYTKRGTNSGRQMRQFFGHPSFVVLSRQERSSYDGVLRKVLPQVSNMTSLDIFSDEKDIGSESAQEDSDTLVIDEDERSHSPSASGNSVQGEEGLVDVSMREASPSTEQKPKTQASALEDLINTNKSIPRQLHSLFDINVWHTEEGVPLGWNSLQESSDLDPLHEIAKKKSQALALRPKHISEEAEEQSSDDQEDPQSRRGSASSTSEAGASPPPQESEDESGLPEVSNLMSFGKDDRGARKRRNKKTYKRKGKIIQGQAKRRTPPPQHKPQAVISDGAELIMPGDGIVLDWNEQAYEALFTGDAHDTMRGTLTHRDPELFEDEELAKKRETRLNRKKTGVSLEDCLEEYGKTETLSEQNAWYCPRCKEHRRAEKQFELWKVPDVLVMHLKRFSSARNFRDKLELKVEYPVEGLDLTKMVKDDEGNSLVYDLIAVDNHYGGLGGGHYTAYAKNAVTSNWYDYNDTHVSQVKDPEAVVNKSAYLLFYRRRSQTPLGGPNLEKILTEVDSNPASRDASPSGEGQRLGGSSHNGSSSASAGQAHHVGDGGSAANKSIMRITNLTGNRENEDDLGGRSSSYGGLQNRSADEALPGYEEATSGFAGESIDFIGPSAPWEVSTWNFDSVKQHPNSTAGDSEKQSYIRLGRRNSDASDADADSTGGLGGSQPSDRGNLSDYEETIDFEHDEGVPRVRESAPPPEDDDGPALPNAVIRIPMEEDDEDELEVKELRIDSEDPGRTS